MTVSYVASEVLNFFAANKIKLLKIRSCMSEPKIVLFEHNISTLEVLCISRSKFY